MAQKHKRAGFKDYISFGLIVALHRAITSVSWPCARRLAISAADLAAKLDRGSRKQMMEKRLKEVFPHLDHPEIRRILRGAYRSLFESIVDALHFHALLTEGNARNHIKLVNESGKPIPRKQEGVILASGHIGWWEVGGMAMAMMGYPSVAIARKMDNPLLEEYLSRLRKTQGIEQLPKKGALRGCLKALKDGKNLAILIDQDARYHGIFVDFLGKPASTYSSPAQLSLATGTPVVFSYCMREGESNRFRIVIKDIVYPRPDADRQAEIYRITKRLTDNLAEVVRAHPHRWLWLHRRWKTYPGKYEGHGTRPAAS